MEEIPLVILPGGIDGAEILRAEKEEQIAVAQEKKRQQAREAEQARAAEQARVVAQRKAQALEEQKREQAQAAHEQGRLTAKKKARAAQAKRRALLEEGLDLSEVEEEVDDELAQEAEYGEDGLYGVFAMPRLYLAVTCITVTIIFTLFAVGWNYYVLPLSQRPFHHLHEILRPSGGVGLGLAVVGTLIMVVSLAYLVRKSLVLRVRWGSLKSWLAFHIFTGLVGPALILFHTAFTAQGTLGGVAFGAMIVVVASGMLGRYFYAHVPKTLGGRELEFEAIRQRLLVYRKKLVELGVSPKILRIDASGASQRVPWVIQAVIHFVFGDKEGRREYQKLEKAVSRSKKLAEETERILTLMRRLCKERQWLVRYRVVHNFISAWRFFHRWLAIVMLVAIFFHIAIGIGFGSLWIFGGGN